MTAPGGDQATPGQGGDAFVRDRWTEQRLAFELQRAYERGRAHVFGALLLGVMAGAIIASSFCLIFAG